MGYGLHPPCYEFIVIGSVQFQVHCNVLTQYLSLPTSPRQLGVLRRCPSLHPHPHHQRHRFRWLRLHHPTCPSRRHERRDTYHPPHYLAPVHWLLQQYLSTRKEAFPPASNGVDSFASCE
ncbi:hypothetical protein L914_09073 [Phytophthora nicotianae]|uniref:Uncharacterized protein n=1 Tax=Phytophthora nicotianae TaxID=4792 RepID=W2NDJ7_PHYNI|nr:hypothetical protein L914_09073 [Phytophthora nicotianae]